MENKCKHKNTVAYMDPLNIYFGISYECTDCGEMIKGDDLLASEEMQAEQDALNGEAEAEAKARAEGEWQQQQEDADQARYEQGGYEPQGEY